MGTYPITALGVGSDSITAVYSGDGSFNPSTSSYFDLDDAKAVDEHPDNFTFNGNTNALTTINKNMVTNQSDKVRLFFADGGPNIGSNFHINFTVPPTLMNHNYF